MLFAFLPGLAAEGGAGPETLDGWQRLHLEGRKFLIAKAHVDLERWPEEGRLRVESRLSALGADREHLAYAWEPRPAEPLAWVEISVGRKLRAGLRLPGAEPALEVRRYEPDDEGRWSDRRVKRVELVAGELCLRDAWYALLALPQLAEGETHRVLTKDGPIELRVKSSKPKKATLRLEDLGSEERRDVAVELVELQLTRGGGDGETLLGLSGPTVLVFDRSTGALVEARGEKDGVPGTIRLKLTGYARTARPWDDPELPKDARERLGELDAPPRSP